MEKKMIFVTTQSYEKFKTMKQNLSKILGKKVYYADVHEALSNIKQEDLYRLYIQSMTEKFETTTNEQAGI